MLLRSLAAVLGTLAGACGPAHQLTRTRLRQAAVHSEGHPPAGAQEEDPGPGQDVLPRQGPGLPGARPPAQEVQVTATASLHSRMVCAGASALGPAALLRACRGLAWRAGTSTHTSARSGGPRPRPTRTWPGAWQSAVRATSWTTWSGRGWPNPPPGHVVVRGVSVAGLPHLTGLQLGSAARYPAPAQHHMLGLRTALPTTPSWL